MEIYVEFRFEAARRLPERPEGDPLARLHGHSFRVEVWVEGRVDDAKGWVMDFAELRNACESMRQRLDYRCLNEIDGLENPTTENIARWIFASLQGTLPGLARVVVYDAAGGAVADRRPSLPR